METNNNYENNRLPGVDVHCHIFDTEDITYKYLGVRLGNKWINRIKKVLDNINPFFAEDNLSNIVRYIQMGENSTELIFDELRKSYEEDFIFTPLMIDTRYCIYPKLKAEEDLDNYKGFNKQIEKLRALKESYPDSVYPFLGIDPRRPNINNIVKEMVGKDKPFYGLKLYPPFGYLPAHPVLMEIYEYCQEQEIPVTSHCSYGGFSIVSFQAIPVKGRIYKEGSYINIDKKKRFLPFPFFRDTGRYFAHPKNWIPVLDRFPDLRLNLAHFGGGKEIIRYNKGKKNTWTEYIIKLMKKYDNLYTDVAYAFNSKEVFPLLKNLLSYKDIGNRILYGSDFYMNLFKFPNFKEYINNFRSELNDEEWYKLSRLNPYNFLLFSI
jgi:uncharacterized protein